ncbi:MAG: hypothetical protein H7Y36_05885 [Armatimonadetes bacterium]|nr:hypothetical protein [Akkermansiaceae bacterium]
MKTLITGIIATLSLGCLDNNKDSVWWGNEKTIIELAQELELAQYRARQLQPQEIPAHPVSNQVVMQQLLKEIEALEIAKIDLQGEIAEMSSGWNGFRNEVLARRRSNLLGKTHESFTLGNNKTYTNAVISKIDDGGVSLRHADGTARFRFNDLNADEQTWFGLDGELALIAHQSEGESRVAYEKWIDKNMAIVEAKEASLAKIRKEDEEKLVAARSRAASLRSIASASTSPLSASIGPLGATSSSYSRYSGYSTNYSYRRPAIRYRYYYNTTPNCNHGIGVMPPRYNRPTPPSDCYPIHH